MFMGIDLTIPFFLYCRAGGGWLCCGIRANNSLSLSLQDSIPLVPIFFPISSSSLFLTFFFFFFFFCDSCMYFSWLADFPPTPSITRPRTLLSFDAVLFHLKLSCCQCGSYKSAGCRLDGLYTQQHSVYCTSALIYQVHSPSSHHHHHHQSTPSSLSILFFFFFRSPFAVKFKFDDVHTNTITWCSVWNKGWPALFRSNQFGYRACGLQEVSVP